MSPRASQGPAAEAPKAAEGKADEITVTFRSEHARLILYTGGKEPTARFEDGVFTTSDPKIIAALRERGQDISCPYEESA